MGLTALLLLEKEGVLLICIALQNPLLSAELEPANFGSRYKDNNLYTTENDFVEPYGSLPC
jgi:hypothetical protein